MFLWHLNSIDPTMKLSCTYLRVSLCKFFPPSIPSFRLKALQYFLVISALALAGCNSGSTPQQTFQPPTKKMTTKKVVVVSYPLQYLVQRIVGDAIEVSLPIPKGAAPQSWRPDRESISEMQSADLIFANGTGATYAKWLTTVTLPASRVQNTAQRGLSLKDYIAVEDITIVHSHGPEGEHSHPTMVARTWLDPAIAKKQAIYIADQLKSVYPEFADGFDSNLSSLNGELDEISQTIEQIKSEDSPVILTATPRSKFFSRAIAKSDHHLTWLVPPTPIQAKKDLEKVMKQFPDAKPSLILFDGEPPSKELASEIRDAGLRIATIELADQAPEVGNFLRLLRDNVEKVSVALPAKK